MGKADLLGEVPGFQGDALLHGAAVGRLLPQKDFQQGGLAGAVVPQKGDSVPWLHPEGDVVEKGPFPEGLLQLPEGEQVVGQKLRLAELGLHLPLLLRPGGAVHLGNALFDGEGPFVQVLRVVLVHHPGGLGEALDLRLLLFVLAELL